MSGLSAELLGGGLAGGPELAQHSAYDVHVFQQEGVVSTHAADLVKLVARQPAIGMVPTERLLVRRPDDAIDHPICHPVGQGLYPVPVDGALRGLPVHLLLDCARDIRQRVAIDIGRPGAS